MENLKELQAFVLDGETGSGNTTQNLSTFDVFFLSSSLTENLPRVLLVHSSGR